MLLPFSQLFKSVTDAPRSFVGTRYLNQREGAGSPMLCVLEESSSRRLQRMGKQCECFSSHERAFIRENSGSYHGQG
jgi:hypothetical protein